MKNKTLKELALENLCHYDIRNPNCTLDCEDIANTEQMNRYLQNKNQGKCYCRNCYHGRTKLAESILTLLIKAE